jgi:hypothetical protein
MFCSNAELERPSVLQAPLPQTRTGSLVPLGGVLVG